MESSSNSTIGDKEKETENNCHNTPCPTNHRKRTCESCSKEVESVKSAWKKKCIDDVKLAKDDQRARLEKRFDEEKHRYYEEIKELKKVIETKSTEIERLKCPLQIDDSDEKGGNAINEELEEAKNTIKLQSLQINELKEQLKEVQQDNDSFYILNAKAEQLVIENKQFRIKGLELITELQDELDSTNVMKSDVAVGTEFDENALSIREQTERIQEILTKKKQLDTMIDAALRSQLKLDVCNKEQELQCVSQGEDNEFEVPTKRTRNTSNLLADAMSPPSLEREQGKDGNENDCAAHGSATSASDDDSDIEFLEETGPQTPPRKEKAVLSETSLGDLLTTANSEEANCENLNAIKDVKLEALVVEKDTNAKIIEISKKRKNTKGISTSTEYFLRSRHNNDTQSSNNIMHENFTSFLAQFGNNNALPDPEGLVQDFMAAQSMEVDKQDALYEDLAKFAKEWIEQNV